FEPVKERGLEASAGGTDFGMLFLAFSFFLIAAALLLVGLLFRLNLDHRAADVGLLLAVGYRLRTVRWLLLGEGSLLAVAGVLVGSLFALAYADLLLRLLVALWPGGAELSFLRLHATPQSFLYGAGAAFATSVLTVAWATRVLSRVPARALLAGETTPADPDPSHAAPRWSRLVAGLAAVGAAACLVAARFVQNHEAQAMTFF